jgi:lipopolysaccharide/colanic/teichoic acid biosynthesis glycosyltransferase
MRRLLVKPGLTCIWQVSGRSELSFPIQLSLDLHYIRHRNLWLDLKLILLTIPAILTARGAY